MTAYFLCKYHAASRAQGYTRNAYISASLSEASLSRRGTVSATGWAE